MLCEEKFDWSSLRSSFVKTTEDKARLRRTAYAFTIKLSGNFIVIPLSAFVKTMADACAKAGMPAVALRVGWWRRWESNPCPHCK